MAFEAFDGGPPNIRYLFSSRERGREPTIGAEYDGGFLFVIFEREVTWRSTDGLCCLILGHGIWRVLLRCAVYGSWPLVQSMYTVLSYSQSSYLHATSTPSSHPQA